MDYTEKTLRRINEYRGVIVDLTTDMVELTNGAKTVREVVHHPGGVTVIPVDSEGNVYCVRQYRYPMKKHLLEVPAGKLERGEEPYPAAVRELSEETGISAGKIIPLGRIYTSPGFSTETLYLYLATELSFGKSHPDNNEFLDMRKLPLSELYDMVLSGEIEDAKTVAAVLKAKAYMDNNSKK